MFRLATVSLRPEVPEDRDFLVDLYLSTRDDEAGFRDLPPAERTRWLVQQYEWQTLSYRQTYPHAWFTIVMVEGRPAGRLYVARMTDCLRVMDISLLPEFRGHGIGTQLLKNVQAEGQRTQVPVRLEAVIGDPVQGFYQRLGFRIIRTSAMRHTMEWTPPRPPGS
ncbi:GNAT family N-acetyltransferase [Luteolibacter flavescens]|uniref:GNAT family N-acetyltransferase n=1 Tax=Luteolibacter flavescens TaxID=1859460 RepID=A0ABT3FRU6_9BACT|nr:GNAT family N-acetyltransferase [Luteolibacter flavescens]MCW1886298.1 GNAT family N-acetyltransferase [Luteolibacter flavescens]